MHSRCLSAAGIRFLDVPFPLEVRPPLRLAHRRIDHRRTPLGFPRSAPTRCNRVGCRLYSGAVVPASTLLRTLTTRRFHVGILRLPNIAVFVSHRFRRPKMTEPHRRFTLVHPSGLPLARLDLMARPPLWLSSQLRTPSLPMTLVGGGDRSGH